MKQCPNPNCTIYTSLEELPDAYLLCPLCREPLVEDSPATQYITSSGDTSPYVPVPRQQSQYVQAPLLYGSGNPYVAYEDVGAQQVTPSDDALQDETAPTEEEEPPETLPVSNSTRLRNRAMAAAAVLLIAACVALLWSVGSRFLPAQPGFGSASATQQALAQMRPPVNTPIALLPTIPLGIPEKQPGNSAPSLWSSTPIAGNLSPASITDATLCARLEGGQPVGATEVYAPADPFNLAVQAKFGPGGVQTVLTKWYDPDGAFIYELRQNYAQQGAYYAGFTLSKNAPWPAGGYRVDLYTNGSTQPDRSVSFSVR